MCLNVKSYQFLCPPKYESEKRYIFAPGLQRFLTNPPTFEKKFLHVVVSFCIISIYRVKTIDRVKILDVPFCVDVFAAAVLVFLL